MNKEEIQERIRYSSISYAREHGIISKEEADFILDEYVKEYRDAQPHAENESVNLKSYLSRCMSGTMKDGQLLLK
jgi:hypothetical protein